MTDKTSNEDFMGYNPNSSGGTYECLPEGTYDFVVHGIIGLGLRPQSFEGQEKPPAAEIKIIFEIPEQDGITLREDGQTELLSLKMKISNHERSGYYKFCTTVMGASVTSNEDNMKKLCTATGMKELLGKTGTLTVATWKNGQGRSVSNKGFYPSHPKAPKPVATRETVFFNPFAPDIAVFRKNLTSWTRKQIMEAVNASSFSDELKQAYEETKAEDEAKRQEGGNNKQAASTVPWEGNTAAIQ